MRRVRFAAALIALALVAAPSRALETDQFYAWTRPLKDATAAINEKINAEIAGVLAHVNGRRDAASCSCQSVLLAIHEHLDYVIIARPELWATKTTRVDRIPATVDEEARYRREWLFGGGSPIDRVHWMPPSPTIESAGIRFGADKLGHFFSEGGWFEEVYRKSLNKGVSDDEAVRRALRRSISTERTIWGRSSSGIISLGDLEANYQGMMFYRGLCGGPAPQLVRTPSGWTFREPFDLSRWVIPEWDESWQPNIYTAGRWTKVKQVMERHCAELDDPMVRNRRASYAARDRITETEHMLLGLVAAKEIEDPARFTIEAVCGTGASPRLMLRTEPSGSGR